MCQDSTKFVSPHFLSYNSQWIKFTEPPNASYNKVKAFKKLMVRNVMTKKYRFKFLVFPEFQLTLVLLMLAINMITLLVIAYFVRNQFKELWESSQAAGMTESSPYYLFIQDLQTGIFKKVFIGFAIGSTVSALLSLRISHRFAGPLYRLRVYFEAVKNDGFRKGPLKFRTGDYLYPLGETIEAALQKIENKKK